MEYKTSFTIIVSVLMVCATLCFLMYSIKEYNLNALHYYTQNGYYIDTVQGSQSMVWTKKGEDRNVW